MQLVNSGLWYPFLNGTTSFLSQNYKQAITKWGNRFNFSCKTKNPAGMNKIYREPMMWPWYKLATNQRGLICYTLIGLIKLWGETVWDCILWDRCHSQ